MDDVVQFRWDKRRLNWFIGLFAMIGVPGLLLFGAADIGAKTFGLVWAALAGIGIFALARRKRISEPVIEISSQGIFDRRIANAVLPWRAISNFEEFEAEHVPFVGLDFHDARKALADAKPIVRLNAPLHKLFRFPAVSIQMGLLDGTEADLLAAIRHFRPASDHEKA